MRSYLGFILLISAAAAAEITDKTMATTTTTAATTTTTTTPITTPTPTTTKLDQRNKRQLSIPVYYDNFNANPTVEPSKPLPPLQPLQPLHPLQPVGVVTPVVGSHGGQNWPFMGALLPLQNLLAGLNLGNFGSFGQLGSLPGFGPTGKPPASGAPAQTCSVSQKLSCRCEPLVSLPLRQPESQSLVQILKQNARHNEDGSQELRLELSNGQVIYQRTDKATTSLQGYYAVPFQAGHYLNIRYSINEANYTIKAEMDSLAPSTDFEL
ncbi:hypothetical protein AWZ03_009778 [Drosophila navojoa]|uniref:DUF4794 domain-containing protein n=1 Tax=Drosophila navojoa TaxID=7232 RepID=A0A484B4N3_DRONA|nr:hypothetical protein AWZ03_009778 [Drosophila navojoa]